MAKNLVIVESPAKCKTISKYLGKDFAVRATMGHIIDLPEKELGVDIEHDFKPKYTVSKGKRTVLKGIKEEADKATNVFLAPDPDREGEAIAWHVAQNIDKDAAHVKRVLFNEITKKAVLAAIENPREIDINKVNAQQARRILDRIVGYQVSPVLWKTVFRGLSAGRVQSVALRLICEREDAIGKFITEEYWTINALCNTKGASFSVKLLSKNGEKIRIPDEAATKAISAELRKSSFVISDVVRSEKIRKPYAPFITSTLQQEAARKLYFSAAKTMMVAQQLYEGLELGAAGSMGLITYMRTDSTRIADEAMAGAKAVVVEKYGEKYYAGAPRQYGKSKNAQDAHEAIRPSQVALDFAPDAVKQFLTKDQHALYDLIWKRFLASQMAVAVFDAMRIDIAAGPYTLRATGSQIKFDGFLALYDETSEEPAAGDSADGENQKLPTVEKGDKLTLEKLDEKQHFTQPPPRYSEASLVKELEEKGIGRPSTYAQIIDTLKKRKYVLVDNRRFTPTDVGMMVNNILVREFSDVIDVNFTAGMETILDKVEEGETPWASALANFYTPFKKNLDAVTLRIKDIRKENQETTDRVCPQCGNFNLMVKWSKNGKFLACAGFPACHFTEPLEKTATPELTGEVCIKCGAPMQIVAIGSNRFLGCSKYPECKHTRAFSTGVHCPEPGCTGMLLEKRTKRGKIFYGCGEYPKCQFATWDKPIGQACTTCKYPMIVLKTSKKKGTYYFCTSCKTETEFVEPDMQPQVKDS